MLYPKGAGRLAEGAKVGRATALLLPIRPSVYRATPSVSDAPKADFVCSKVPPDCEKRESWKGHSATPPKLPLPPNSAASVACQNTATMPLQAPQRCRQTGHLKRTKPKYPAWNTSFLSELT